MHFKLNNLYVYTKFWIGDALEANKTQEMRIYGAGFIDYSWHTKKC